MVDIAEFHCANIKYQELEGHIQRNICLEYRAGSYAIDFQIESVLALNKKTESESEISVYNYLVPKSQLHTIRS